MGSMRGHYVWDDDNLTPGKKKEGGLHQNLFDGDGNLRGSARFIPESEEQADDVTVTEFVYVPADQRRRSREDEELQETINLLVAAVIDYSISKARPFVAQWWRETASPALGAQRRKVSAFRARRRGRKADREVQPDRSESSTELVESPIDLRPAMSSAEAQARYLAALAAQAYSDEQMRLIDGARIVGASGIGELQMSLSTLPPTQVRQLLLAMATDPSLLSDSNLADLASIIGRHRGDLGWRGHH